MAATVIELAGPGFYPAWLQPVLDAAEREPCGSPTRARTWPTAPPPGRARGSSPRRRRWRASGTRYTWSATNWPARGETGWPREPAPWRRAGPDRACHAYSTPGQSYADRLYDTLQALHARAPLDVVDVPDAGGEAVTLLRAKRLLRRFPRTTVAVTLEPARTARYGTTAREPPARDEGDRLRRALCPGPGQPRTVGRAACTTADGVTSARLRRYLPGLPDWPEPPAPGPFAPGEVAGLDGAAPVVLWIGPIGAGCGTRRHAPGG